MVELSFPNLWPKRVLSNTLNWWHKATESWFNPPSFVGISKQLGKELRLKLVVKGMVIIVVVNWEIVFSWKIMTGRIPACSEPCVWLRVAI